MDRRRLIPPVRNQRNGIPPRSGAAGGPCRATARQGGGASSGAPSGTRPQPGSDASRHRPPGRFGARPSRAAAVQAASASCQCERQRAPFVGLGRNLRTASAVRNFAGASPKCAALGNARGAPCKGSRIYLVKIRLSVCVTCLTVPTFKLHGPAQNIVSHWMSLFSDSRRAT